MKRLAIILFSVLLALPLAAQTSSFDDGWRFAFGNAADPQKDFGCGTEYFNYFTKAASIHNVGPYSVKFDDSSWTQVQLPHDWVVQLPFSPDASKSHGYKTVGWKYPQTSVGWYRKHFTVPAGIKGQKVSVRFDGIFRDSQIWVNGFWLGGNRSGYTSASYEISPYLNYGEDNIITVRADATFEEGWFYEGAGIYRHTWLTIGEEPAHDCTGLPVIELSPDQGIIVDGKRIQLRGVNLHQDHAGVGSAIPDELYEYRLRQLQKLGVNAIRTSHNPASPVLLDLCDKLGIYVLEETRLMGINDAQLEPLRSMIERDKHHPCIIMWGIGNEEWGIEWDAKGQEIARRMTEFCHSIDPTRPVVVATSSGPEPVKGTDIAGYNYILQNPVEQYRADFPQRIAVGTEETTGCGTRGVYYYGQPGRMPAKNRFPQGPDSLYNCIERGMRFYEERPWLGGFFYWTGFDYRGEPDPLVYPATGSQFGILDYCGFPKDEAYYLKSWWTDEPVLHILPHWNLEGHEGEKVPVWVYSNCDEIALIVNGKNLGRKKMPRYGHLEWTATYKPGNVRAIGYKNGRKILEEVVYTAGEPAGLKTEYDGMVMNVSVVDAKGHFVPTACIPVTVSVDESVRILGAGNGDSAFGGIERPVDADAKTFTINTFNGRAQFLLQNYNGVVNVACDGGLSMRLQVISPEIIRVSEAPEGIFTDRQSLVVLPQKGCTNFTITETDANAIVSTDKVVATVDKAAGTVSFSRPDGTPLATDGRASFKPARVEEKDAWSTTVSFASSDDEAFYGLGQHQSGEFNHAGRSEELFQYNTKVSVPFVVSNKGYGLLFDAYSLSRWGNPEPYMQLGKAFKLYDKNGEEGALTGTYTPAGAAPLVQREDSLYYENEFTVKNLPKIALSGSSVVYEGFIQAPETADYHFIQYYAGFQRTFIGGKEVMSRRWRPAWNPNSYKFTVHLEKGVRTPVRIEWEPDGDVSYIGLRVADVAAEPQGRISFWSEFEPQADYYFIAADNYDGVIKGYRQLTGKAQVMPKWVLGFWQSRERYSTQEDLVSTLAEFRRRHIPVDNIVQDWQYWKDDQWGSHEFDESRYPDPEAMLDTVHAMHGRFMISVWPKFYTNTDHYKELKAAGYAYTHAEDAGLEDWLGHKQSFYDAYAQGGRDMFWHQMDQSLYSKYGRKIDAWWMDASEPNLRDCLPLDYMKWLTTPNALGSSTEYLNAYALVNAKAIYEGQRSVDPDKRVFLLTRNGFAGLQRYSTATWSGDIGTTWTDMRTQMAAGLNYSMSGIPFWGMDIGGFSVLSKYYDKANEAEWQELQTRWHQFGTFVPLFRTHGQWPRRELWNIAPEGSQTYESILYYMRLRYRLMPYLYSVAGAVHNDDASFMRGLPMDYPDDPQVRDLSDQWLLGPALMPCPVYEYQARSRSVYFPKGGWYDFYTNEYIKGGRRMTVAAPYERIPLYVRAGSIVPIGPDMEWSDQLPGDELTLLVYPGADADFTLYQDDGLTYAYERGEWSAIRLSWNDAGRILTIGSREGSYPGMPEQIRIKVIFADGGKPVETVYNGNLLTIR